MLELAAAAAVVAATGGAIVAGLTYGGRYVDQKLRYEEKYVAEDKPIVLKRSGARDPQWRVTKT